MKSISADKGLVSFAKQEDRNVGDQLIDSPQVINEEQARTSPLRERKAPLGSPTPQGMLPKLTALVLNGLCSLLTNVSGTRL